MIIVWIVIGIALCFGFVVAFGAPYVPTLHSELRQAFAELYPVSKTDVVVDLGAGDGQVVLEAARRGARAYGYELNPLLVLIANLRLRGWRDGHVQLKNMWTSPLPAETTLVYVFMVTRDRKRLTALLQTHATNHNKTISVLTFGQQLEGVTPIASLRAHSLYKIQPIHQQSA